VPPLLEMIQVAVAIALGVTVGVTLMHALDRREPD
jgi:hypothetical protein